MNTTPIMFRRATQNKILTFISLLLSTMNAGIRSPPMTLRSLTCINPRYVSMALETTLHLGQ